MSNEYVVSIKITAQVSPDDWAVIPKTLKVTSETTISQIEDWLAKSGMNKPFNFQVTDLEMISIEIIQQPADDLPY